MTLNIETLFNSIIDKDINFIKSELNFIYNDNKQINNFLI
jgi:hypothetical protein